MIINNNLFVEHFKKKKVFYMGSKMKQGDHKNTQGVKKYNIV